jgi:hypothetical protein
MICNFIYTIKGVCFYAIILGEIIFRHGGRVLALRKELETYDAVIAGLNAIYKSDVASAPSSVVFTTFVPLTMPQKSNRELCIEIINKAKKFLSIREIANAAQNLHPKENGIEYYHRALSAALSHLKREGALLNTQTGKSRATTCWGLSKWLDEKGNIKSEYAPDNVVLAGNQHEDFF